MPFYEYECANCGNRLEVLQQISDAPLTECSQCGASSLRRLVSAAGFRLKGSGWYATDFKNSGKQNPDKSPGKSDKGTAKSEESAGSAAASTSASSEAKETKSTAATSD